MEGALENLEINTQGNGHVNSEVPNGKAVDKEVTTSTSTHSTTVFASTSTSSTVAFFSTMATITLTPIVSIAMSLPTPIPTSIPIPTHTPTHTKTIPLTTPFTQTQVDIPITSTPHTGITTPATMPAPTPLGPHVHINIQAQASVPSFLPSLNTYTFTTPGINRIGAHNFLQSLTLMNKFTMGQEETSNYKAYTG